MRKNKLGLKKFYVPIVSLLILYSLTLSGCSLVGSKTEDKAKAMQTVSKLNLSKQDLKDEKIRQSLLELGLTDKDIADLEKTLPDAKSGTTVEATDTSTANKGVSDIQNGSVTTEKSNDSVSNVKTTTAESQEDVYNSVKNALENGEDTISIKSKTIDKNAMEKMAINAVEYYGYGGYISEVSENVFLNNFMIYIKYKQGKDIFKAQISQVKGKVSKIVAQLIKPGMNDFQKEKTLHDYVVNNTRYDQAALSNLDGNPDTFTAYGVLFNKKAVCEGYAETMYRLLNAAGIENILVKGQADDALHEWNIVKINGKYYHLDATFDDPVADKDYLDYNYFNLTDKEISKNHSWDQRNFPGCQSTAADYFIYNGLYVNSTEAYKKLLANQIQNKVSPIILKTETFDKNKYNTNTVNDVLKSNPSLYKLINANEPYSYSYDDNTNVMAISLSYK